MDSTEPTGLLTDRYELTMLDAALRDGSADRQCTFEVFARRLPDGRRYGVVAGTARLIDAITNFSFGPDTAARLAGPPGGRPGRCALSSPTTASTATSTATPRASCTSPTHRC